MVENFAVAGRITVKLVLAAAKTAGALRVLEGTRRVLVAVRILRLMADMVIFSILN